MQLDQEKFKDFENCVLIESVCCGREYKVHDVHLELLNSLWHLQNRICSTGIAVFAVRCIQKPLL